ncbi:Arginine repressor [Phycisphaerae bacterium RAS1]|nr:Arginine repressor [Phycisphaerae bacterium RAS1]
MVSMFAVAGKNERQALLSKLAREQALESQEQIVALLREKGLEATQASVSRDLRELALLKVNGRYVRLGEIRRPRRDIEKDPRLDELITAVDAAGASLVVVRTVIGAAGTVAVALDERKLPEIVGTIAGDDTIFVAVRSRAAQGRVTAFLRAHQRIQSG